MLKRDIVFRGARICDGQFVNGSLVEVNGECDSNESAPHIVISYGPDTFDWFEVDPETVGQFTGMTDKTGKKIFEGDIIKWIDSDGNNRIDKVLFSNGGFHLCNIYYNIGGYKGNSLEVIGNIHDNKELLK